MMSTRLINLYTNANIEYQINIIAGKKGLYKVVDWVYQSEDITTLSFLRGSELIITTGLTIDKKRLIPFTKKLIEYSCCGLILNIGAYIKPEDITDELITLCEQSEFPLFTMPWEVHISDVMQSYCYKIFSGHYLEKDLTSLFCKLIFNSDDTAVPLLNASGFVSDADYCLMMFKDLKKPTELKNILNKNGIDYHSFEYEGVYIVVCQGISYALLESFFADYGDTRTYVGISEITDRISRLHFCCNEARNALAMAEHTKTRHVHFKDLDTLRILLSVPNHALLNRYCTDILQPLIEYDRENSGSLTKTLETYLNCNGSIRETATAMFTHRNTINYRMKRVRELLKNNLDTPESIFGYTLAFKIMELSKIYTLLDK